MFSPVAMKTHGESCSFEGHRAAARRAAREVESATGRRRKYSSSFYVRVLQDDSDIQIVLCKGFVKVKKVPF